MAVDYDEQTPEETTDVVTPPKELEQMETNDNITTTRQAVLKGPKHRSISE